MKKKKYVGSELEKEYLAMREKEIAKGKNRFGAPTKMACPHCGEIRICSAEMHLCTCEHFRCGPCRITWSSDVGGSHHSVKSLEKGK